MSALKDWMDDCTADPYVSIDAIERCVALDLRPKPHPLGDAHHCDEPFSEQDKKIGDALAYFMGTLWSDVEPCGNPNCYHYSRATSVEEWQRVARALRIHGLKIANLEP